METYFWSQNLSDKCCVYLACRIRWPIPREEGGGGTKNKLLTADNVHALTRNINISVPCYGVYIVCCQHHVSCAPPPFFPRNGSFNPAGQIDTAFIRPVLGTNICCNMILINLISLLAYTFLKSAYFKTFVNTTETHTNKLAWGQCFTVMFIKNSFSTETEKPCW